MTQQPEPTDRVAPLSMIGDPGAVVCDDDGCALPPPAETPAPPQEDAPAS